MEDLILKWYENKSINPYTKRKIKENSITYKKLMKQYNLFILNKDINKNDNIIDKSNDLNDIIPINSIEDIDIISLNQIWEIKDNIKVLVYENKDNLITYKDENNNIHCFEKESIQYLKDYNIILHPITKVRIPQSVLDSVNIVIKKVEKTNNDLALEVVQLLTNYSYFIDRKHIINLNINNIIKLYQECHSFINYNIPKNKVYEMQNTYDIFKINPYIFPKIKNNFNYLLKCFIKLLEYNDDMIKIISSHIIMAGLSIVNKDVKQLYPDFTFGF